MTFSKQLSPDFDLVIFDCDGVLVDSEALSGRVWEKFLAEFGLHIPAEEFIARFVGMTDTECGKAIEREHGIALPPGYSAILEDRANAVFDDELELIPHVAEAIQALALPSCVCSNSGIRRLERSLRCANLFDLFGPDRVFSAQLVETPKPAPDLHLYAARKLGADPARCIVIEDSLTGARAAKAAGMSLIGFTGAVHGDRAQTAQDLRDLGAVAVFDDMRALAAVIGALGPVA